MNEKEGRTLVRAVKAIALVQAQHKTGEVALSGATYERLVDARKEVIGLLESVLKKAEDAIGKAEETAERKRDMWRELLAEATEPAGPQQEVLFDQAATDNPEAMPGVSDASGQNGAWSLPGLEPEQGVDRHLERVSRLTDEKAPELPEAVQAYLAAHRADPYSETAASPEDRRLWNCRRSEREEQMVLALLRAGHTKSEILKLQAKHTGCGGQHEAGWVWDGLERAGLIARRGRKYVVTGESEPHAEMAGAM